MQFFSQRKGINKNLDGFDLEKIKDFFRTLFKSLKDDGYFDQYLGSWCVDSGYTPGVIINPELDITLKVRKENIWPIEEHLNNYSEDDLFDIIEYLFLNVSKPIDGTYHSWSNCGTHWHSFNKQEGEVHFREKINELLALYKKPFEFSEKGEVLQKPESGFTLIHKADAPTQNTDIKTKLEVAKANYLKHGATLEDRKVAVRQLADILEFLRPQVKEIMGNEDESALFNIANNFSVRHFNKQQKSDYDPEWLSWIFYLYLSTIHLILRKIQKKDNIT